MSGAIIRLAEPADGPGAYYVCLKTGDHGADGEPFYREDPDALGRIFVGPYLAFEPLHSFVLEDGEGICGYALGAFDSRAFYARYEAEWRPDLCARYPAPQEDPQRWTRVEQAYSWYHHPDYFCPEPYEAYPSHLHIDLLPRVHGQGHGRRMLERLMDSLRERGSPGAHLGMSVRNTRAYGFYMRLGFRELVRDGTDTDGSIYMGIAFERRKPATEGGHGRGGGHGEVHTTETRRRGGTFGVAGMEEAEDAEKGTSQRRGGTETPWRCSHGVHGGAGGHGEVHTTETRRRGGDREEGDMHGGTARGHGGSGGG
ncbi:MAG: GNAT family N-acetyltransferase [Acidobacteria bacterium]|nr:GNAT family N-acetyltransferase [Acidobacteriota bacterium]